MFAAMRPDPDSPAIPAPAPTNGSSLAAEVYVAAGRALEASGNQREAQRYFESAAALARQHDNMTPNVGNARGDTNFGGFATGASAEALIKLAKDDIANRNYKAAIDKLQSATQAKPTAEQRSEINQLLLKQVIPHLNR
jgi:tetratricopeptide (TPR) repeat protein